MILAFLDYCPPRIECRRKDSPINISAIAKDGSNKIEIKVAGFATRIAITEIDETEPTPRKPTAKRVLKRVHTFHEFSAAIISTYCLVYGCVVDNRARSVLADEDIKDFENSGWPIGMYP